MTINSVEKGKRGERDFAKFLRHHGYHDAIRGQQHSGGEDSPDVICDSFGFHVEVKRCEKFNLYKSIDQANNDCGNKTPIVVHKKNRKPWVIIMKADDFMGVLKNER